MRKYTLYALMMMAMFAGAASGLEAASEGEAAVEQPANRPGPIMDRRSGGGALPQPELRLGPEGESEFLKALALEYKAEGEPDYKGAYARYQAAARAGSREALLGLARLSKPGGPLGLSAEIWRDNLAAAAGAGWPEAAFELAQALEQGLVKGDFNPGDFYFQAAKAGHIPAARRLGELYLARGGNSPEDEKSGFMWLTVAAENHEPEAALALGRLYYEKNPSAARHWLEKAESPEAFNLLGRIYLQEKRFVEAVTAFTVAADQNYAPASLALGLINLDNDFGFRPKAREALRHFKSAAQAGLPEGAYQLAHMYLNGQATPKDSITGAYWLHKAAAGGHEKALEEFEKLTYNFSVGQKKRLERMIEEGPASLRTKPEQDEKP